MNCCDNNGCIVIQIMPPGEWTVGDNLSSWNAPLVGWGLKECGAVLPLVLLNRNKVEAVVLGNSSEDDKLNHPNLREE